MQSKGIRLLKVDTHPDRPWLVSVPPSVFGKQIRKRFESRDEAKLQMHSYMIKAANQEQEPLDPDIHRVVAGFQSKLSATQIMTALTTAVELQGLALFTLEELANEYLEHQGMLQERGAITLRHLKDAQHLAPKIVGYLDNPNINAITTEQLDNFVDKRLNTRKPNGKLYSPRTVINEINFLSALFNYGIKKGHMIKNPTLDVKMPDYKAPVGICKLVDLENLLEHAGHFEQCQIMFGAFGGLRSSEIFRMKWSDVRLDEGQFYIEGSKNEGAERWIKMTPPLMDFCKAILEGEDVPDGLVMGGMTSQTQQRKIEEAYKKAGYRIPKNGLRHSFGSHHLVHYQNADNTANEMGHVGPQQTFKAYRKAVLKSQAAEFFAMRPEAKAWVISAGMGIKKPRVKAA